MILGGLLGAASAVTGLAVSLHYRVATAAGIAIICGAVLAAAPGLPRQPYLLGGAVKTIHVQTDLPTTADKVWRAMQHPAAFLYVTRGLFGFPALAGRTEPVSDGEHGTGWLLLFHVIPLSRHTIQIEEINKINRTLRTREHGGILRAWNHTLHVEPTGEHSCRYSDTVDIDAGILTGLVALAAMGIYRYRQRRWHKLVRRHLLPTGPRYAHPATS
jgi:hypothetical protein